TRATLEGGAAERPGAPEPTRDGGTIMSRRAEARTRATLEGGAAERPGAPEPTRDGGTIMSRRNAGFTLVELMVAIAVLAVMMLFAWGSISQTVRAKKVFGAVQDRYREARNALTRIVHDVEMAYLSGNEDRTQVETRTFFVGESSGEVQSVRFSAFAH